MFKLLICLFSFLLCFSGSTSIYSIPVPLTDSTTIDLHIYQGKKILFVNTASNSQFVGQYSQLDELSQQYKDSLAIIAIPSNSFENEPEDDSTISSFVTTNFRITFPLAAKGNVKGDSVSLIYNWLQNESRNGAMSSTVKGDFQKYLVDENGNLIGVFAPSVDPMSDEIINAIKGQ